MSDKTSSADALTALANLPQTIQIAAAGQAANQQAQFGNQGQYQQWLQGQASSGAIYPSGQTITIPSGTISGGVTVTPGSIWQTSQGFIPYDIHKGVREKMFEGFVLEYLIDQGRAHEVIKYLRLKP